MMKTIWRSERASQSNACWFVGIESVRVSVIAPPGVAVARCREREAELHHGVPGWRWATWNRYDADTWPIIDDEAPDAMREIDTLAVLQLLDEKLHEDVWSCLWSQLQIARRIGQSGSGVPSEDLARAGAFSTTWLSNEIVRAFPERAHLLGSDPDCGGQSPHEKAPDDATELFQPPATLRAKPSHVAKRPGLVVQIRIWEARKAVASLRGRLKAHRLHATHAWHVWRHTNPQIALCAVCQSRDAGEREEEDWSSDPANDLTREAEKLLPL